MPRPKVDKDKISAQLLDAAEKVLEDTQGRRLILSDVAARVGMSQSYAHRFFPTKADLIRALAARWFAEVEAASGEAARGSGPVEDRLAQWVLDILQIKRAKFDANPALYLAYLDLAADHMDMVATHVGVLRDDLKAILCDMVTPDQLEPALSLTEDATLMFRTPYTIARHRAAVTDDRAMAVVKMLIAHLRRL